MYYFKESLFIFFYEFVMSTIALAVVTINATWLKLTLSFVCIAFFLMIIYISYFQVGQKALKNRHQNDLNRKRIIETGEDIEIDEKEEYKPYKGFVMGLFAFIPMFLLLLIYAIILICGGASTVASGINSFIYMLYAAPIVATTEVVKGGYSFIVLYGVILTSIASGVGYILGARKIQKQYDAIEEKQKYLHGENN